MWHIPAVSDAHALLLEKIHPSAEDELRRQGFGITRIDKGLDENELIDALTSLPGRHRFVGIRSKTQITARVIDAVPELSAIGAFCIGTDQIALGEARRQGVAVFNAPFSSTRSVAELVMAEVVMLSRQIFPRNASAHAGGWLKTATGSHEVRGKTLGIIGYGHIGSQLSILAEAFGMNVIFYDIVKKLPLGNATPSPTLDDLLERSQFVTLHVPDTERTRSLIGAAELDRMQAGAHLINASRGRVVDLPALRHALEKGRIAGAAIDVYPQEPASIDDRFVNELQGLDNVILTPHIGGSTEEAQANIGLEVATALARFRDRGTTSGSVTLPQLEVPAPVLHAGSRASRIINVHQNVPGVLSSINQVIAQSGINIVGQSLGTLEEIGLLFVDMPVAVDEPQTEQLCRSISALPTSVRTRSVELPTD
jgi:D-3-phosphoglycerate dehydrogenase / 2-oxoglutarate reductase